MTDELQSENSVQIVATQAPETMGKASDSMDKIINTLNNQNDETVKTNGVIVPNGNRCEQTKQFSPPIIKTPSFGPPKLGGRSGR